MKAGPTVPGTKSKKLRVSSAALTVDQQSSKAPTTLSHLPHMGHHCTTIDKEDGDSVAEAQDIQDTPPAQDPSHVITRARSKLIKRSSQQPQPHTKHSHQQQLRQTSLADRNLKRKFGDILEEPPSQVTYTMAASGGESPGKALGDWSTLTALNRAALGRKAGSSDKVPRKGEVSSFEARPVSGAKDFGAKGYFAKRGELKDLEHALAFDYDCRSRSSQRQKDADVIIQRLREEDEKKIYGDETLEPVTGFGGQTHKRFPGDHFLTNQDLIDKTHLFRIARRMPKGAHLHIHFNSCLKPIVLLSIAAKQDRMFIRSTLPLLSLEALDLCEITFSIISVAKIETKEIKGGNLFDREYEPKKVEEGWMRFDEFRGQFEREFPQTRGVMPWLVDKLEFHAEEAHNSNQTVKGAWEKFNGRTRMMKGLFNYESAYREYTRLVLQDFVDDNIQYAEIRPNFMHTNQVWKDDGTGLYDNYAIMNIIDGECKSFLEKRRKQQQVKSGGSGGSGSGPGSFPPPYFKGIRVIYCTPRSFKNELVSDALAQCIEFKKKWPHLIAGFDLVGEEAEGKPLREFAAEFLEFKLKCEEAKVDIPFLFHCGETLSSGEKSADENLYDAILLGSRRIGHGFALPRHPLLVELMKSHGVCVELCPISNEILGLTPRASGHAMYPLLANNVHCALSSDNGTLFRSSLSHDFYQAMVGKEDFTLHGWRQLAEWSIEHACLDHEEGEREEVFAEWERAWDRFLEWVVTEYKDHLPKEEKPQEPEKPPPPTS